MCQIEPLAKISPACLISLNGIFFRKICFGINMRKLFGTDGVRGVANTFPMIPEIAMELGRAMAFLSKGKEKQSKIIIGKDTRISGYMFETALASGVCSMGMDVMLTGPLPTPGIANMTVGMRADCGAVISASHNPYEDNGIKFFGSDGFKLPDAVEEEIEQLIDSGKLKENVSPPSQIGKASKFLDAAGRYVVFIKGTFPKDLTLSGMRIVVDCANGAAYRVAPSVLYELGANVIPVANQPDGININRQCGSLFPENLSRTVREKNAHIGIALDGDADRVILCDEKGNIIDGDMILAICGSRMASEGKLKQNTIVATSMSNIGFEIAMKEKNIRIIRTDVGDRYVVEEMRKGAYNLGGEQSGHIIFLDETTTGDGVISALKVLSVMVRENRPLSELKKIMSSFPQVLLNLQVKSKPHLEDLPGAQNAIRSVKEKLGSRGRVVVRYSGTGNLARVMVEGENEQKVNEYASDIIAALAREIGKE
jgi:phosphoglucosamine mutase